MTHDQARDQRRAAALPRPPRYIARSRRSSVAPPAHAEPSTGADGADVTDGTARHGAARCHGGRTSRHGTDLPRSTCWIDTEQPDLDAAEAVLRRPARLGVHRRDTARGAGPYVIATLDGLDVAALAEAERVGGWNTYVAVDDADARSSAPRHWARRCCHHGRMPGPAARRRPARPRQSGPAVAGRRRKGAQRVNAPGAWNFSNLHATDPGRPSVLRRAVRRRFVDQGWATAISVPGYGDHLEATVDPDIRTRQAAAPEGFEDVIGHVPAGDEAAAGRRPDRGRPRRAARAEALGGTCSARRHDWTREAVVRDPQGAVSRSGSSPPDAGGEPAHGHPDAAAGRVQPTARSSGAPRGGAHGAPAPVCSTGEHRHRCRPHGARPRAARRVPPDQPSPHQLAARPARRRPGRAARPGPPASAPARSRRRARRGPSTPPSR